MPTKPIRSFAAGCASAAQRADAFRARGGYADAEALDRRALAVREEVLGPRHHDTAESHNNLALDLQQQGRAREAEPLYRKARAAFEEVLGATERLKHTTGWPDSHAASS